MLISIGYIIASLAALYFWANWLVKGASSLAERLGVSTLVVGLTVVAFGTSNPELIVSTQASVKGFGGIALGNAIGSNIANIGIILGLSALIFPLKANMQLIRFDTPVMILTAILFLVLGAVDLARMIGMSLLLLPLVKTGFTLKRWEGGLFILIYVAYIVYLLN